MMIWELSGDTPGGSMVRAMHDGLGQKPSAAQSATAGH